MPGIGTTEEPRRVYPQGALAAQLLGSVGTDNYGLSGLEQSLEKRLHGTDGKRRIVNDALGQPVSIVDSKRAKAGNDVKLTIDANIQERVEAVLAGSARRSRPKGATAIVMDPRTARSSPSPTGRRVDPSNPGGGRHTPRRTAPSRATTSPARPSRPSRSRARSRSKLITPQHPLQPARRSSRSPTARSRTPRRAATRQLTVAQILAQSSNVGAVKIGMRLGATRFDHWVRRFGFGASTGDRPARRAAPGIVLTPSALLRLVDGQPADRPGPRGHADADGGRATRRSPTRRDRIART